MRKLNESGTLVLPLVFVSVALLGSLIFAGWAFSGRQNYKNNTDAIVAKEVKSAVTAEGIRKDAIFADSEKSPLKTYTGSATYGSLTFQYPKTWSAYISEGAKSDNTIDGYFSPNFVPDIDSKTSFALRIQVVSTDYTSTLSDYDSDNGDVSITAFRAAKVPTVLGSKVTGKISNEKEGTLILLPVRDKTIIVWTEGTDYLNDFNNSVLPSLSFIP